MKIRNLLALAVLAPLAASAQLNLLSNGGFESVLAAGRTSFNVGDPLAPFNTSMLTSPALPGWQTDASDGKFEIWQNGGLDPANVARQYFSSVGPAASLTDGGRYWAELNANEASNLSQIVKVNTLGLLQFSFQQKGRLGVGPAQLDTLHFSIVDLGLVNSTAGLGFNATTGVYTAGVGQSVLFEANFSADSTAWVTQAGNAGASVANHYYLFSYASLGGFTGSFGPGGQSATYGNFIDNAAFGVGILSAVPEPSTYGLIAALSMVGVVFARRFFKKSV